MPKKKVVVAMFAAAVWTIATAVPAAAHPGHTSCKAAGQFAASLAQSLGPDFGAAVSSLAQQGAADDFVAAAHATLCAQP